VTTKLAPKDNNGLIGDLSFEGVSNENKGTGEMLLNQNRTEFISKRRMCGENSVQTFFPVCEVLFD
jgi:hypothetical protein